MATRTWELRPPVELRSVDPARNRFRRYKLTVQGTLFDAVDLFIEWGRLGQVPRARVERFTDSERLETRWRELVQRRRQHGYVEAAARSEETSAPSGPTREVWMALAAAGGLR